MRQTSRDWRKKFYCGLHLSKFQTSSKCSRQFYRISSSMCKLSYHKYITRVLCSRKGCTIWYNFFKLSLSWTREVWGERAEDIHRGSQHRCNDTSLLVNRYHCCTKTCSLISGGFDWESNLEKLNIIILIILKRRKPHLVHDSLVSRVAGWHLYTNTLCELKKLKSPRENFSAAKISQQCS